jgi:lysophospholipase L1-like esterase
MTFRFCTALSTALTASVLPVLAIHPASAATSEPLNYVALGDSYAAAPLVLPIDTSDLRCSRSLADYPHAAAKALGAKLTDVSCSGATVDDFNTSQFPGTKPQYDALNRDTDIVSVTIGGNDSEMVQSALGCLNLLPKPVGSSCAARYTKDGTDLLKTRIDAWAPAFGAALDRIGEQAPKAKVFVVGYGNYIRPGGCYPTQPIWDVDADYIQGKVNYLSTTLKTVAQKHGATFVDTYSIGVGHDTCAAPADRYMEGLMPTHAALPLHPNAAGSHVIGQSLAEAVRATTSTR